MREQKYPELGAAIHAAREWAGVSLVDTATFVGASLGSIWEWEKGHKQPGAIYVDRMATAFGLSADQVLGRQPLPPKRGVKNHA